jgi:hypothetical protein
VAVNPHRPDATCRTGDIRKLQLYSERHTRALRVDPIDDVEIWEKLGRLKSKQQNSIVVEGAVII